MKLLNKISLIVLVVLLLATVYGLIRTERESGIPAGNGTAAANRLRANCRAGGSDAPVNGAGVGEHADQRGGATLRPPELCSLRIRRWIWRSRWRCSTRRNIRPH